ncbi:MAG: rhodanese-like domain-containing protein [Kofleriaceae bacterium]|nr:rhodanese-like domain-containing protein [Kofleriaceae bacterium]
MRMFLASVLLALAVIPGCSKANEKAKQEHVDQEVAAVSIDQLETMLANNACIPVDANGEQTRRKLGTIPGAVLLSDSETFATSELPVDKTKQLVFYCANTSCGASDEAANKARTAGYTNVKVLPEGIAGWRKAGKKIQNI